VKGSAINYYYYYYYYYYYDRGHKKLLLESVQAVSGRLSGKGKLQTR